MAIETTACTICCDTDTGIHVPCEWCSQSACVQCIKTFILGIAEEARCMFPDCKRTYSYEWALVHLLPYVPEYASHLGNTLARAAAVKYGPVLPVCAELNEITAQLKTLEKSLHTHMQTLHTTERVLAKCKASARVDAACELLCKVNTAVRGLGLRELVYDKIPQTFGECAVSKTPKLESGLSDRIFKNVVHHVPVPPSAAFKIGQYALTLSKQSYTGMPLDPAQNVTCSVCTKHGSQPKSAYWMHACGHTACRHCWSKYLSMRLDQPANTGITCMACPGRLSLYDIASYTTDAQKKRFVRNEGLAYIDNIRTHFSAVLGDGTTRTILDAVEQLTRLMAQAVPHADILPGCPEFRQKFVEMVTECTDFRLHQAYVSQLKCIEIRAALKESIAELETKYNTLARSHGITLYGTRLQFLVNPVSRSVCGACHKALVNPSTGKCPNPNCHAHTCPQCGVLMPQAHAQQHTCSLESMASLDIVRKTSKPCPGCGINIEKGQGCNQMFCTVCHTAFDWTTLSILDTRAIHNPHLQAYNIARGRVDTCGRPLATVEDLKISPCLYEQKFLLHALQLCRHFQVRALQLHESLVQYNNEQFRRVLQHANSPTCVLAASLYSLYSNSRIDSYELRYITTLRAIFETALQQYVEDTVSVPDQLPFVAARATIIGAVEWFAEQTRSLRNYTYFIKTVDQDLDTLRAASKHITRSDLMLAYNKK